MSVTTPPTTPSSTTTPPVMMPRSVSFKLDQRRQYGVTAVTTHVLSLASREGCVRLINSLMIIMNGVQIYLLEVYDYHIGPTVITRLSSLYIVSTLKETYYHQTPTRV